MGFKRKHRTGLGFKAQIKHARVRGCRTDSFGVQRDGKRKIEGSPECIRKVTSVHFGICWRVTSARLRGVKIRDEGWCEVKIRVV